MQPVRKVFFQGMELNTSLSTFTISLNTALGWVLLWSGLFIAYGI